MLFMSFLLHLFSLFLLFIPFCRRFIENFRCRSPHGERGLKSLKILNHLIKKLSLPTRERGLKCYAAGSREDCRDGHSSRGSVD